MIETDKTKIMTIRLIDKKTERQKDMKKKESLVQFSKYISETKATNKTVTVKYVSKIKRQFCVL